MTFTEQELDILLNIMIKHNNRLHSTSYQERKKMWRANYSILKHQNEVEELIKKLNDR